MHTFKIKMKINVLHFALCHLRKAAGRYGQVYKPQIELSLYLYSFENS